MNPNSTGALRRAMHPAFLAGVLLSCVGIAFNVSYGWSLGGSDPLRAFGMAGVFLACIALKDSLLGQLSLAVKNRKAGVAMLCAIGLMIGLAGSFMAAFGSASEGREEKSDPRAQQITAYKTAEKVEADASARLNSLGDTLTVKEAEANVTRALSGVDRGIAKRTQNCTVLTPEGSGKKQQRVNAEACQPVLDVAGQIEKAKEAQDLRAKIDAAREILAQGAPKAADPMVANLEALYSKIFGAGEASIPALLSLLVAAIVEIGAPIAWAIWQLSGQKPVPEIAPAIPANDQRAPDIPAKPIPGIPPKGGGRRGRKPNPTVLDFSETFRKRYGRAPSGSEIKMQFPELPTSTAYDYAKRRA